MTKTVSDPITIMKRHELKYLLDAEKTAYLKEQLKGHMCPDEYGLSSIASLYYDTPDHRLIRASLDKPLFKEKLRARSYGLASDSSPVFLELKCKAEDVVYKRRVRSTLGEVDAFFAGEAAPAAASQIGRELDAFRALYEPLRPACLIIYDRLAYYQPDGDLRLTIDSNPRYRMDDLDLRSSMDGVSLLPEGWTILELTVQDAIPLWMAEILSRGQIYRGSFSKYGAAYARELQAAG